MRIVYSKYDFEQTGRIYIATDRDDKNPYFKVLRKAYSLEIPVLYMLEHFAPGDKFIDVGANIGAITLPIAKSGVRTLAIEALPDNYLLLLKALERNHLTNVTALHAAAYHSPCIMHMAGHGPWGYVTSGGSGVPVAALRVDDVAEGCDFTDARFVKIDVEGGELAAIEGMDRLLQRNTQLEVVFESNAAACRNAGYTTRELLAAFEKRGYRTYMFMFGQKLLVPRTSSDLQELTWVDFLATKKSPQDSFGSFEVRSLTLDERIALLVSTGESSLLEYRQHVALVLEEAPQEILDDSRIRRVLSTLVSDRVEQVRTAAAWARGTTLT